MLRLLAILALLTSSVQAQTLLGVAGPNNSYIGSSPPAGYQGPGDIASGAIAFYSAGRAYNAPYATAQNPLADIVDTATGLATCTINAGTNGYVNLTAIVCPTGAPVVNVVTFCTVTHAGCSVTKLYDQTGNGIPVLQATLASMPLLGFSAQNGLPCLEGNNSSTMGLVSSASISRSAPYSMTAITERTGSFTTAANILTFNSSPLLQYLNTANTIRFSAGTFVPLTAADNSFHALLAVASSTDPLFAIDSSSNTSTSASGTTAISGDASVFNRVNLGLGIVAGFVCEGALWPSDQNANYVALLANMRSATNGWNF